MPPLKTVAVAPTRRAGGRKTPSPAVQAEDITAFRPDPPRRLADRAVHRYRIGERLRMAHGGNVVARSAAYCKVMFLLPYEGHGPLLYRVRSDSEQFERIVAEADLSRNVEAT